MPSSKTKIDWLKVELYSTDQLNTDLLQLARVNQFKVKVIGQKKSDKLNKVYPLYRFTINPGQKKRLAIVAGVHGYEIAGPFSILALFQQAKKFFSPQVEYRVYPLLNPTSFDLRQRYNDFGADLNLLNKRSLNNPKYAEIQAFYTDIKDWPMSAFISLHEDVDLSDFYAYIYERKLLPIYRQLIVTIEKSGYSVSKHQELYGSKTDGRGLIINHQDQSLEAYLWNKHLTQISICTETPGQLTLPDRVHMNLISIKLLSDNITNL